MKLITYLGIIALGLSLPGCTSSKFAELESRVNKLEANPPELDDVTQNVLDIAIGGPLSHPNEPSQPDAVLALALFGRTETAPEIIRLAKATQNDHLRMKCVNALGWMKYEDAVPYLKEAMKNDSYKYTRRAAAVALETITGEKFLTQDNGFETKEMILERLKKEREEKRKLPENTANQALQPTVKTPVESGNEQGTATEL